MKALEISIICLSFFILSAKCMGQRDYLDYNPQQDSIFFKQVNTPLKTPVYLFSELNDTIVTENQPYNYRFHIDENRVGLQLFDKSTDTIISEHVEPFVWWRDSLDTYHATQIIDKTIMGRSFLCLGMSTYNLDTSTCEVWTFPAYYAFEVDSNFNISLFDFSSKFSSLGSKYAFARTSYYSGGGFSSDCSHYYTYYFGDSHIETPTSYTICFGGLLLNIDSIHNNYGMVFGSWHPDVNIFSLECVSADLKMHWNMENTPSFLGNPNTSISINGRKNYMLSQAMHHDINTSDEYFNSESFIYILDLEKGAIVDTIDQSMSFSEIKLLENGQVYFLDRMNNYFVIDHLKHYTKQLNISESSMIGDTIGLVIKNNFYGNGITFQCRSNGFAIDSKLGIITLQQNINEIDFANDKITCEVNDGFDKDIVEIELDKVVSVNESKDHSFIYPNPANSSIMIMGTSQQIESVLLFDVRGELVKRIDSGKRMINIDDLEKGVYLVMVIYKQGIKKAQKIVIQ